MQCAKCQEPLDGRYWTSVPGFGNLCNDCHEAEFNAPVGAPVSAPEPLEPPCGCAAAVKALERRVGAVERALKRANIRRTPEI